MQIENTATAYAVDLGLQCDVSEKLRLGVSGQNVMASKVKFNNTEEAIAMTLKASGAYMLPIQIALSADINMPQDNEMYYSLGIEKKKEFASKELAAAARLGFTTKTKDIVGTQGISGGLGITYKNCTIDYATQLYGDLGTIHKMSFSILF